MSALTLPLTYYYLFCIEESFDLLFISLKSYRDLVGESYFFRRHPVDPRYSVYTFRRSSLPTEFRFTPAYSPLSPRDAGEGKPKTSYVSFSFSLRVAKLIHTIGEIESPHRIRRYKANGTRGATQISTLFLALFIAIA